MSSDHTSLKEIVKETKVTFFTACRWDGVKKLLALKAGKQYRDKKEDLDSFMKEKV